MARATLQIPTSETVYTAALEGLTRVDQEILRRRALPPLYRSGAVYKREPREVWRTAEDVNREKWGDCEDLAAYRAAELRNSGEDAGASVVVRKTGHRTYHAQVRRGDGRIEDPSRVLGMGKENDMFIMRSGDEPEAVLGADPRPGNLNLTWEVERTGNGWRGIVRVPLATGKALLVKGPKSSSKGGAVNDAISLASKALNSPAAQALLPGPAKFALNLFKSGTARNIAKKIFSIF